MVTKMEILKISLSTGTLMALREAGERHLI
jgi:hypothetical protein